MPQLSRISKNNTTIHQLSSGTTKVVLHSTQIVIWNDKTIHLNTGGWPTVTTCTRMNQVSNEKGLGYTVGCRKGQMTVRWKNHEIPFNTKITLQR